MWSSLQGACGQVPGRGGASSWLLLDAPNGDGLVGVRAACALGSCPLGGPWGRRQPTGLASQSRCRRGGVRCSCCAACTAGEPRRALCRLARVGWSALCFRGGGGGRPLVIPGRGARHPAVHGLSPLLSACVRCEEEAAAGKAAARRLLATLVPLMSPSNPLGIRWFACQGLRSVGVVVAGLLAGGPGASVALSRWLSLSGRVSRTPSRLTGR